MAQIKRSTRNKAIGLAFISPWLAGFLIFTLYPIIETIRYSFSDVSFLPDKGVSTKYVGLNNFVKVLFVDPDFKLKIPEYLQQLFLLVPMVLVFSVLLALLLNTKLKFRRVFRAIFFLPVIIISGPVLSNLTEMGATKLNGIENFFVFKFIKQALPGAISAPLVYIFQNVVMFLWFSGVQILIFLSALQKVDKNIYEAAMVDGASGWQKFWKITMPTLKPFIYLNAIYTIVDVSKSSLNPFIEMIKYDMFRDRYGFGFSAAATWIYFAFILLAVFLAYLLFGRGEK
ncbi:MAG TPA: sugar ABC transporter permease, partial [Clostridiaceae bacterium]|nr:sugar ABC transporter permease [Clostridiaceae bacterium]